MRREEGKWRSQDQDARGDFCYCQLQTGVEPPCSFPRSRSVDEPESSSGRSPVITLCLAKCLAEYAWTCPDLRRHARLRLNLDLDFNLDPVLRPALNRALFEKPFQLPFGKSNPALFRWLYGFKYRTLLGLENLTPCHEM